MSDDSGKFSCASCGRSYPWRAQLAGRQAKCKCGAVLTVPPQADPPAELYTVDEAPAAAPQARCPSCQEPIGADAIICTSCGFNVRTGQRLATALGGASHPAAPAPAAAMQATVYPGYARRPAQEEPAPSNRKFIILGVVVLLLAMVGGGLVIYLRTGGADENKPRKGRDAAILKMMKDEHGTEAKKWLEDVPAHLMGNMTRDKALSVVDRFYRLGAVKVIAFGTIISQSVAIELPADPDKRKALFDVQDEWHNKVPELTQVDVGQQYLQIVFGTAP